MLHFLFGFFFGAVAMYLFAYYVRWRHFKRMEFLLQHQVEKEPTPNKVLNIEFVAGKIHAYDSDNDLFLCRFETFEELVEQLERIDPKIEWRMRPDDVFLIKNFLVDKNER